MGQHKYNPMAQAANRGELMPKKKAMPKSEAEWLIRKKIQDKTGLPGLVRALGGEYFYV